MSAVPRSDSGRAAGTVHPAGQWPRGAPYHTSLTNSSKAPGRTKSSLPMAQRRPKSTSPGILRVPRTAPCPQASPPAGAGTASRRNDVTRARPALRAPPPPRSRRACAGRKSRPVSRDRRKRAVAAMARAQCGPRGGGTTSLSSDVTIP